MMSDSDNMDVIILNENINPIERYLANTIEGSDNHSYAESTSHTRRKSSQENEFRGFRHETNFHRQDSFFESMETFTYEINLRLSQEMDSMMHLQINRDISSAIA